MPSPSSRRQRHPFLLPSMAALMLLLSSLTSTDAASQRQTLKRHLQASVTLGEQIEYEQSKEAIDPTTCALKQYTMAVLVKALTLTDSSACADASGGVNPYVVLSAGGKTVRTKTGNGAFPVYLETFQLGCQDIYTPLEVNVVNDINDKVCMTSSVQHWTYGDKGVKTDTQPPQSLKAKSGGFGIIPNVQQNYPYVIKSGESSLDIYLTAVPGPQDAASKWNLHTAADIFGIVAGMMAFAALIAFFIYKIRNSASGPPPAPDATTAAPTAADDKKKQAGKAGGEQKKKGKQPAAGGKLVGA